MKYAMVFLLVVAGVMGLASGRDEVPASRPATVPATGPAMNEMEKKFAETMSGAVLVGKYTVNGKPQAGGEDRYTISDARKLFGDRWVISARIEYGGKDVTVPVPVRVVWAGDTAVIQMTNAGVPGMGAFTVRVLVYDGQYAGTWEVNGAGVGGQMYGRIERAK